MTDYITLRRTAEQALDFLTQYPYGVSPYMDGDVYGDARELAEALRAALAAPAPEPVAWRYQDARGRYRYRGYVAGFDVEYAILKPVLLIAAPRAEGSA